MNIQNITGFDVTGISVRTCNQDEMNPDTAKIGTLWQTFFTQIAPKLTDDAKVYGVYTHYESDHTGMFDVIAGAEIEIDTLTPNELKDNKATVENVSSINIQSGKYLVFSATGEMPNVVITLWQEVWQYFADANCPHERAYTTDFEYYKSDNEIDIYIAIK